MINPDLSFSTEEFQSRLDRVRQQMRDRNIDLLILDEIESMTYVCGYGVSENLWRACAIPIKGVPFLLVRSLDVAPARERSWFSDIIGFKDWEDPVRFLVEELRRRGLNDGRVGVDYYSQSMPFGRLEFLRSLLPKATVVDFGRGMWEFRLKKSPAEIDYLRQAATVVDAAMRIAIGAVRVGGSQREVAAAAAAAFIELGADTGLVGPITSGTDWDSLHTHLHSRALEPGVIVHIELVPRVRGYSSRLMRSVAVGKSTAEQRNVAALLVELQDRQIDALRPGAFAHDIDRILRQPLLERGLRPSYDNITGYTLGLLPFASQRSSDFTRIFTPEADWIVEAGMTLHMYTSARGLAFSETVVVNAGGAERLTRTERKLFETG